MNLGIFEIVLILLVGVIIFGANKIPAVMGDFGKGIRNFKQGLRGPADAENSSDGSAPPKA